MRRDVEPWYRYNLMLFVRSDLVPGLEPAVLATRWPAGRPVRDLAPWSWRLRRAVLSKLPVRAVSTLATAKHHVQVLTRTGVPDS